MTTPLPLSDLHKVNWKPCTKCKGKSVTGEFDCVWCQCHGVEPVAVENPIGSLDFKYKLQVGKVFNICLDCGEIIFDKHIRGHRWSEKFLPLYPKVKGDNSVMMVVRCG